MWALNHGGDLVYTSLSRRSCESSKKSSRAVSHVRMEIVSDISETALSRVDVMSDMTDNS
jgi:hypothetical protein